MTNWAAGMDMTTARLEDSTKNDKQTFTPSFNNGGSATYTTQSGFYFQVGKLVYFNAYMAINAGGSGSTALTFNGPPLDPDRTNRQAVLFAATSLGGGNSVRTGFVISYTGGSGIIWDAIFTTQNTVDDMAGLEGSNLSSGALIVINGWYLST